MGRHVTIVKLDLQRAFDKVLQTAIVEGVASLKAHPRHLFALCRELIDPECANGRGHFGGQTAGGTQKPLLGPSSPSLQCRH